MVDIVYPTVNISDLPSPATVNSGADTQCVMVYSDGTKWLKVMDNKAV